MELLDMGLSEKTWNLGKESREVYNEIDQVREPLLLQSEGGH